MSSIASHLQEPSVSNKAAWKSVASNSETLLWQMNRLYWYGIERDLDEILRTLNFWQDDARPPDANMNPADWLGFEAFARRATGSQFSEKMVHDILSNMSIEDDGFTHDEMIARALLRATGMLDIDKVVEYREPEYKLGLWLRPRAAQLQSNRVEGQDDVHLSPMLCSGCHQVVRGSHFERTQHYDDDNTTEQVFCETCARGRYSSEDLHKKQKHCVIATSVTEEEARQMCKCYEPDDSEEKHENFFPFSQTSRSKHTMMCPLAQMKYQHCAAKLRDLEQAQKLHAPEQEPNGGGGGFTRHGLAAAAQPLLTPFVQKNIPYGNVHMSLMVGPLIIENGVPDSKGGVLISVRERLRLHPMDHPGSAIRRCFALSPKHEIFTAELPPRRRRIKAFMKQVVGSPFWDLPGAGSTEAEIVRLMASSSKRYADMPMKTPAFNAKKKSSIRKGIMWRLRKLLQGRLQIYLYSLVNKLFDPEIPLAWHITQNSCQRFCETLIDRSVFGSFMINGRECAEKKTRKEKHGTTDALYLLSFVSRVGCHDGFPRRIIPVSSRSAANSHTEEFVLRYRRFGHHNDTDIVDSLAEYWTDWGGFREPIFENMDLFPWDCTEARSGNDENAYEQVKCGDCKLSKHLWAFPFDSWSISQLHLLRDPAHYASRCRDPRSLSGQSMGYEEWLQNRLKVLESVEVLGRTAAALHRSTVFRSHCQWDFYTSGLIFLKAPRPASRKKQKERGQELRDKRGFIVSSGAPPAMIHDRVKMAGIHRAQPSSHIYEQDALHDCRLADWADLRHEDQVAAYSELRNQRAVNVDETIRQVRRERAARSSGARPGGANTGTFDSGGGGFAASSIGLDVDEPGDCDVADGYDGSGVEVSPADAGGDSGCTCLCDSGEMGMAGNVDGGSIDSMGDMGGDGGWTDGGGGGGMLGDGGGGGGGMSSDGGGGGGGGGGGSSGC